MGSPATTCTSSIARCRDTTPEGGTSPLVGYVETQAPGGAPAHQEGTESQTQTGRRCRTDNSPRPYPSARGTHSHQPPSSPSTALPRTHPLTTRDTQATHPPQIRQPTT